MAFQAAGDKAAAMEINQGGQWSHRRDRRIGTRADVAAGPGNGEILHLADGDVLGPGELHHAGKALARHGGRDVPNFWARNLSRPVEKGFDQWVERHEVPCGCARRTLTHLPELWHRANETLDRLSLRREAPLKGEVVSASEGERSDRVGEAGGQASRTKPEGVSES